MHPFQTIASLLLATCFAAASSDVIRQCQYVPIERPPRSLHCEEYGSLKSPALLSKGSGMTYSECISECLQNPQCISFDYQRMSATCSQYSSTLTKQGFKQSRRSETIYSNRRCFTCKRPTTTTTTTTFTAATSTVAPQCTGLQIQASGSNTNADGEFTQGTGGSPGAYYYTFFTSDPVYATNYMYDAASSAIVDTSNGQVLAVYLPSPPMLVTEAATDDADARPLLCDVDPSTNEVTCTATDNYGNTYSNFFLMEGNAGPDNPALWISGDPAGVTLTLVNSTYTCP